VIVVGVDHYTLEAGRCSLPPIKLAVVEVSITMFDIIWTGTIVVVIGALGTSLYINTQRSRKRNKKRNNSDDLFDSTDSDDGDDGGTDIEFGD
jgi:hypothetical protein